MATMTIEVDGFDFSDQGDVISTELISDGECSSIYKVIVDPNEASSSSVWLVWENVAPISTRSNSFRVINQSGGIVLSGIEVSELTEFTLIMDSWEGLNKGSLLFSTPVLFKIKFEAFFQENSPTLEGSVILTRRGVGLCNLLE